MKFKHARCLNMQVFVLLLLSLISIKGSSQPEIGLQLYTFRNQMPKDVRGMLIKIKQMGFTRLEGGGGYSMSLPEFRSLLDSLGLRIVSTSVEFDKLGDPADAIKLARIFDAKYVVCYWIPHNDTSFTKEDVDKAIAAFNKAGKVFADSGLSFCYHPHGYEFRPYETGTLFDYLIKNVDPKLVNFEMDVFWVKQPGQDPVALLAKYRGRFPLMHLKDRKIGTIGNQNGEGDKESNVVLGTGDVGIAAIMKASKKTGVKEFFIEDESSRSEQQVPESLAYLKSLK